MLLRVAQIVERTQAEGPGERFAVWVQGCPIRCRGCCNPEMFPAEGGAPMDTRAIAARALARDVRGVTLLGGEPFAQAEACADLARAVKDGGKTVMVFTGYTLVELEDVPHARALIAACDLLVDGRFERDHLEHERRWIGSKNQVMHFLSDAYDPRDPIFRAPNTAELRLTKDALMMNGWPGLVPTLRRSAR